MTRRSATDVAVALDDRGAAERLRTFDFRRFSIVSICLLQSRWRTLDSPRRNVSIAATQGHSPDLFGSHWSRIRRY